MLVSLNTMKNFMIYHLLFDKLDTVVLEYKKNTCSHTSDEKHLTGIVVHCCFPSYSSSLLPALHCQTCLSQSGSELGQSAWGFHGARHSGVDRRLTRRLFVHGQHPDTAISEELMVASSLLSKWPIASLQLLLRQHPVRAMSLRARAGVCVCVPPPTQGYVDNFFKAGCSFFKSRVFARVHTRNVQQTNSGCAVLKTAQPSTAFSAAPLHLVFFFFSRMQPKAKKKTGSCHHKQPPNAPPPPPKTKKKVAP